MPASRTRSLTAPSCGFTNTVPGQKGTHSQAIGRSRGGPSTKISVRTDALGNLVDFVLLPGQGHDLIGVAPLLDGVECEALIADKAYDSNELRAELQGRGIVVVSRSPRKIPRGQTQDS